MKEKSTFTFTGSIKDGIVIGEQKTPINATTHVTVVGTGNGGNDNAALDIEEMSIKQLRDYLTQVGKDYPSDATKAELREIAKA